MTSLFILLGVLLSSLTVYAEVKPQDDFDVKVEGKWYEVGLASSDNGFALRRSKNLMFFCVYTFNAKGDLTLRYKGLSQAGDKCQHVTLQGKKGSEAGVYIFEHNGHTYTHTFTEVKDPKYAFMLIYVAKGTVAKGVMPRLLARSQEVSDDVKNKWKEIVEGIGLKDENILFPRKQDKCRV